MAKISTNISPVPNNKLSAVITAKIYMMYILVFFNLNEYSICTSLRYFGKSNVIDFE